MKTTLLLLQSITAHLLQCQPDRIRIFAAGPLRIGRTEYPTVGYEEARDTPEGTPAYHRGERTYRRSMLFALGERPASIERHKADAIDVPGLAPAWIAGWCPAVPATSDFARYRIRKGNAPMTLPDVLFSVDPHPGRTNGEPLRLQSARWKCIPLADVVVPVLARSLTVPDVRDDAAPLQDVCLRALRHGIDADTAAATARAFWARRRKGLVIGTAT